MTKCYPGTKRRNRYRRKANKESHRSIFPHHTWSGRGGGVQGGISRKRGCPGVWDTENVSQFDSRIFPAAIVPQGHEEECPFMKKFDSRISMRHNLRQHVEFDSRISMRHDLRQQSGRKGSLTLGFQCGKTSGSNQEGRGVLLSNFNASQLAAAEI